LRRGQGRVILIAQRVAVAVGESVAVEEIGTLTLKGLTQPVAAYNVLEQRAAGGSAEIVSLPLRGREAQ
jgi:class 3 adenylate cyclase